jgi:hypothetical protein
VLRSTACQKQFAKSESLAKITKAPRRTCLLQCDKKLLGVLLKVTLESALGEAFDFKPFNKPSKAMLVKVLHMTGDLNSSAIAAHYSYEGMIAESKGFLP